MTDIPTARLAALLHEWEVKPRMLADDAQAEATALAEWLIARGVTVPDAGGEANASAASDISAEDATYMRAFRAGDAFADALMSLRNSALSAGISTAVAKLGGVDDQSAWNHVKELCGKLWAMWDAKIIQARGEAGHLMAEIEELRRVAIDGRPPRAAAGDQEMLALELDLAHLVDHMAHIPDLWSTENLRRVAAKALAQVRQLRASDAGPEARTP